MSDYIIYHHGIKGQKWGVRNAEWYPIDAYKASKSYSDSHQGVPDNSRLKGLMSETALNAVKVAATFVAPTLALGISAVKLAKYAYSLRKNEQYIDERDNAALDSKTGLPVKNKNTSVKDDLKRVNATYSLKRPGSDNNCMACTTAFELRRRGYDVAAKLNSENKRYNERSVSNWFNINNSDIKTSVFKKHTNASRGKLSNDEAKEFSDSISKEMLKQGSGARGNFLVTWKHGNAGHSLAYEVDDNHVKLYDAQSARTYNDIYDIVKHSNGNVMYIRLDNKQLKKGVKEVLE